MLRIGHRGACGYETENTLASFEKAIALGCDMIECDVRRCAGGEIVVFHDETIDRLSGKSGLLSSFNLTALRGIPLKGDRRIPTLDEAIAHIGGRAAFCIELKEQGMAGDVAGLIRQAVAGGGWHYEQFLIISFYHHELKEMKQVLPEVAVGPIVVGIPEGYAAFAEELGAEALHPSLNFLDKTFVEDAHRRGIRVNTWTANSPEEIAKARALGVDGITSDYPDRV